MPEIIKQTQLFRFDQMAVQVKDKIEPEEADVDRYVGLEHIDPESLKIRRWGEPSDVESSKILFRSGDIIFGKRRAYQRKLAVADFDGICSAHAMVLRPKTDVVLEEFLPFFMQSDIFMDRAVKISVGGLSPTINWRDLAKEEFALPPPEEQRRIAYVLASFNKASDSLVLLEHQAARNFRVSLSAVLKLETKRVPKLETVPAGWDIAKLSEATDPDRPVSYGILKPGDEDPHGVPMLRVQDFDDYGARSQTNISKVSREVAETSETTYLRHGDVVVSIMATIGRAMLITRSMSGWNVNRAIAVLPAGSCVEGAFLEAYLQSSFVQRLFYISQIGGVQSRINLEILKSLPVPIPPKEIRMETVRLRNQLGASLEGIRQRRDRIRSMQNRFLEGRSK